MLSPIYIFTLSFLAGNLSLQVLPVVPQIPGSMGVACAALLFFAKLRWRLLGSFCLGLFWTAYAVSPSSDAGRSAEWEGETVTVVGRVATIPIQRVGSTQFILDVVDAPDIAHFPKRIRTSVYKYGEQIRVTDILHAELKLKAPYGLANPHTFDYQQWLTMRGIDATAYVRSYRKQERTDSAGMIQRWRQLLFDKLQSYKDRFSQIDSIAAITLGLSSLLSYQQRETLSATGTHHLFAVSGLHIGLVFGFFYILIEHLWRILFLHRYLYPSRDVALLGALPAAIAYAALAGFSVPTQRALIMLVCIVCAGLLRYRISLPQSLAVALLLILIYDPLATLSISFWLSFTAVAMIALFLVISPNLRGWKLWFGMQMYIATVMVIPSLLFFTRGALISPFANMVIVPLTAFVVLPCSLMAVAGFMLHDLVALFFMSIADYLFAVLWQINDWFASYAPQWFHAIDNRAALFALIGVVLFVALKRKTLRCFAVLLLLPLLPFFSAPPAVAPGAFKVVFFDVGQGLSVLVRTREHNLIYDTGPRYRSGFNAVHSVILPYLRAQHINTLDTLVVSHADNDHAGGAGVLLQYISPHRILVGEAIKTSGHPFEYCRHGQSWLWDGVRFEILYPLQTATATGNNASCVLRISNQEHSLLLTADIEKAAERILATHPSLSSDVMLVPHHGSRTSSTDDFIDSVSPKMAVVTSSYGNRYALPKPDIIARYYSRGIQVLDTALSG
ncbi:MAG: DNA internalization-related competence protein ComEC/Rec2, partial [Chromatiales bacterium]|nr:DNA internalization-related competence protein ComEC/Rec2 [Chromatiales bacterium]